MDTFIVMHGGLKLPAQLAAELGLDPRNPIAPQGQKLELDPDFVKEVDPAGVQFVTESQYELLLARVEAQEAQEQALAKLRETAETEAQKLANIRVNSKLLTAVKAIEAAKKTASKKAEESDDSKPKKKTASKKAEG